jgi:hypothetical protein
MPRPQLDIKIPNSFTTALSKFMADVQKFQTLAQAQHQAAMAKQPWSHSHLNPVTHVNQTLSKLGWISKTLVKISRNIDRIVDRLVSGSLGTVGKLFMRGVEAAIPMLLRTMWITSFLAGPVGWTIGAVGLGVSAIVGAISGAYSFMKWIWDKMVGLGDAIVQDYLLASGTGATIGSVRALRTTFGDLPLNMDALNKLGEARFNAAAQARRALHILGIRAAKDTGDMMVQAILEARKFMLQNQPQRQLPHAEAIGLTEVFDPEFLIAITRMSEEQIMRRMKEYQRNKSLMQLTKEAVKGWKDFYVLIKKLGAELLSFIAEKLADPKSGLMESFTKFSQAVVKFVQSLIKIVLSPQTVDTIIEYINWLAKYIEHDALNDLRGAKTEFERMLRAFQGVIKAGQDIIRDLGGEVPQGKDRQVEPYRDSTGKIRWRRHSGSVTQGTGTRVGGGASGTRTRQPHQPDSGPPKNIQQGGSGSGQDFYNQALTAVKNSNLVGKVPPDGAQFGIVTGSAEEWARFMTAVASAESSFNPNEGPPNRTETSYGILQYDHGQAYGNAYSVSNSIRAFIRDSESSVRSGSLRRGILGQRFSTIGNHPDRTIKRLRNYNNTSASSTPPPPPPKANDPQIVNKKPVTSTQPNQRDTAPTTQTKKSQTTTPGKTDTSQDKTSGSGGDTAPKFDTGSANWRGLNPELVRRLNAAYNDMSPEEKRSFKLTSGFRSHAEQAEIYRRSGGGRLFAAAPPGRSRHESGNAVDVRQGPALNFLQRNGAKYGLTGILGGLNGRDPVHIQMVGANNASGGGGGGGGPYGSTGMGGGGGGIGGRGRGGVGGSPLMSLLNLIPGAHKFFRQFPFLGQLLSMFMRPGFFPMGQGPSFPAILPRFPTFPSQPGFPPFPTTPQIPSPTPRVGPLPSVPRMPIPLPRTVAPRPPLVPGVPIPLPRTVTRHPQTHTPIPLPRMVSPRTSTHTPLPRTSPKPHRSDQPHPSQPKTRAAPKTTRSDQPHPSQPKTSQQPTPPAADPPPSRTTKPPIQNATLAEMRRDVVRELRQPEFRNRAAWLIEHENDRGAPSHDVLESLVNRAVTNRALGKRWHMRDLLRAGPKSFYDPLRKTPNPRAPTQAELDNYDKGLDAIEVGRNELDGRTDQGNVITKGPRKGQIALGIKEGQKKIRGEWYGYQSKAQMRKAQEQQAAARRAAQNPPTASTTPTNTSKPSQQYRIPLSRPSDQPLPSRGNVTRRGPSGAADPFPKVPSTLKDKPEIPSSLANVPPKSGPETPTAGPNTSRGGGDDLDFINSRGGHSTILVNGQEKNVPVGTNSPGLNAPNREFTARLVAAAKEYERQTGKRAHFDQFGRDIATQAKYYDRYRRSGFNRHYIAARPTQNAPHVRSDATDIHSDKDFQKWMHENGYKFGVNFPVWERSRSDYPHAQIVPGDKRQFYDPNAQKDPNASKAPVEEGDIPPGQAGKYLQQHLKQFEEDEELKKDLKPEDRGPDPEAGKLQLAQLDTGTRNDATTLIRYNTRTGEKLPEQDPREMQKAVEKIEPGSEEDWLLRKEKALQDAGPGIPEWKDAHPPRNYGPGTGLPIPGEIEDEMRDLGKLKKPDVDVAPHYMPKEDLGKLPPGSKFNPRTGRELAEPISYKPEKIEDTPTQGDESGGAAAFLRNRFKELSKEREEGGRSLEGMTQVASAKGKGFGGGGATGILGKKKEKAEVPEWKQKHLTDPEGLAISKGESKAGPGIFEGQTRTKIPLPDPVIPSKGQLSNVVPTEGHPILGRVSVYGWYKDPVTGKIYKDPGRSGDLPGSAGIGNLYGTPVQGDTSKPVPKGANIYPDEEQGIALPSNKTLRQWFLMTDKEGIQTLVQQTDVGPGVRTTKIGDVHRRVSVSDVGRPDMTGEDVKFETVPESVAKIQDFNRMKRLYEKGYLAKSKYFKDWNPDDAETELRKQLPNIYRKEHQDMLKRIYGEDGVPHRKGNVNIINKDNQGNDLVKTNDHPSNSEKAAPSSSSDKDTSKANNTDDSKVINTSGGDSGGSDPTLAL